MQLLKIPNADEVRNFSSTQPQKVFLKIQKPHHYLSPEYFMYRTVSRSKKMLFLGV